ncbi:MAG: aldehyde ferredoxin oxidoreductase family protein [Actinomycetota bacterium]|nr:aldehyde ferredoxin oxidoreductase family protein [Actinomycetota bacterium]
MDGYAGKILNINLSDGSARDFVVPEETIQKYLGGKGIGTWLLFQGLEPHLDPLESDNVLVFMTGPLTGLGIPAMNNLSICTKSPLTGTIASASLGGDFAVKLKSCGYDGLILRGKSPRPVIIDITQGKFKIREAEKLWGQNTVRTQELLRSEVASTLCIGPAGENLVRYATIVSGEHTAQFGGTGAVMGSKLVKAIRAGGKFETQIFDKERLEKPVERTKEKLRLYETMETFPKYGTPGNLVAVNNRGLLPTRNFSSGTFEHYLKISGEALRSQIRRKAFGCPACPVACTNEVKLSTKSETIRIKGPNYQTLVMLGSNLLVDDLDSIIRNNYLCYLLGMDPVVLGSTIAFATELSERARLPLPLKFGSPREIAPLIPLIAQRKGPGRDLADGALSMSLKYGYGDLNIASKGHAISGYDPRGAWGQGLAYATSPMGGIHTDSMMASPEILGRPVLIPGLKATGKAQLTIFAQNMWNALDCLVFCAKAGYCLLDTPEWVKSIPGFFIGLFSGWAPRFSCNFIDLSQICDSVSFVTGVRYRRKTLLRIGERIFNLERLFNLREGFTSKDDSLPLRFIGEPLKEGPSSGKAVPLTRMILKYYKARNWDEVGIPTREHLQKLGIEERPS